MFTILSWMKLCVTQPMMHRIVASTFLATLFDLLFSHSLFWLSFGRHCPLSWCLAFFFLALASSGIPHFTCFTAVSGNLPILNPLQSQLHSHSDLPTNLIARPWKPFLPCPATLASRTNCFIHIFFPSRGPIQRIIELGSCGG